MQQVSRSALLLTLVALPLVGCSDGGLDSVSDGDSEAEAVDERRAPAVFGADNRTSISDINSVYRGMGSVVTPSNLCTGVLMGPRTVLTARHCLGSGQTGTFKPAYGIQNFNQVGTLGVGATAITRMTRGQDEVSQGTKFRFSADWAILEVEDDLSPYMPTGGYPVLLPLGDFSGAPSGQVPVDAAGYSGGSNINYRPPMGCSTHVPSDLERPSVHTNCSITRASDGIMGTNCDSWSGSSGGPIFFNGFSTPPYLTGIIVSGVDRCYLDSEYNDTELGWGNSLVAAGAKWFVNAPWRAEGVAVTRATNGNVRVFASDGLRDSITTKSSTTPTSNSFWTPWASHGSVQGPRSIAATNLADGRQLVWVISSNGSPAMTARIRYETVAGGAWSNWEILPLPTFGVRQIAAAGGTGANTALYVLSTNGIIYEKHKVGDSNSAWSAWQNLGVVAGATSLTAVKFGTTSYQVVVGNSEGIHTSWAYIPGVYSPFMFLRQMSGVTALGAGVQYDDRVHLIIGTSGGIQSMTRAPNTMSWSLPGSICGGNPPSSSGSYTQLASIYRSDEKQQVLAVRGGEIFTCKELFVGFSEWKRFYKEDLN